MNGNKTKNFTCIWEFGPRVLVNRLLVEACLRKPAGGTGCVAEGYYVLGSPGLFNLGGWKLNHGVFPSGLVLQL